MRRTKEWWAGLSEVERSELHGLEHGHSYAVDNYPDDMMACGACGNPMGAGFNLCRLCDKRRDELIEKADRAAKEPNHE